MFTPLSIGLCCEEISQVCPNLSQPILINWKPFQPVAVFWPAAKTGMGLFRRKAQADTTIHLPAAPWTRILPWLRRETRE